MYFHYFAYVQKWKQYNKDEAESWRDSFVEILKWKETNNPKKKRQFDYGE